MEFHLTQTASLQLHTQLKDDHSCMLKLVYDADGCGCIMSGVSALWLIQASEPDVIEAALTEGSDPSPLPIVHDRRHEVFFEEQLTLDYNPSKKSYILKSKSQIYNNQIKIVDKRGLSL